MVNISTLLEEIERLRLALQAIRDTPRKDGILTCQRIASDALRGATASVTNEKSLGNPDYFREVIAYLHWKWEGRCAYCGAVGEQIDHANPVSRGGSDEITNLVLACESCNKHKGAQTIAEFGRSDLVIGMISQGLQGWRKVAEQRRRDAEMVKRIFEKPDPEQPF